MDPILTRIVEVLKAHPTMPIEATIDHTGGGIFCVRVDVGRISDVGPHDGPFMYLTDGADMGEPGTVAVGIYRTWEDDGAWPVDGDWDVFPRTARCVPWTHVHATVLEGAELLNKTRDLRVALDAFKRATADLDRVWSSWGFDGDEIANYPECLPSFDEFAASVADMDVKP